MKDGVSHRRPPMRVPVAAGSFGVSMVPSATGRRMPVRPSTSAQLPLQAVSNAFRVPVPLTPGVRSSTGIPSSRYANAAEVTQQPRNEASRTEVVPDNHQVQSSVPNDTTSEMKGASDGSRRRQQQTAQSLPVNMPSSHAKRESKASTLPHPALPSHFAGAAGGPGDNNIDRPAVPDQGSKRETSGLEWMNKFLSERFKDRPMKEDAKYGDMVPPEQTLHHFNEYQRPKDAPLPPATMVAINEKRLSAAKKEFKFPPLPRDILKRMKAEREKRALERKWEEKLRGLDIEQRKKVRLAMWQNKPVESILGGELVDFRESVKKEPTLFERMRAKLAEPPKSPPLSMKAKRALAFLKAMRDENRNVQRSRVRKPEFAPSLPPSMKRQRISGGFFGTATPFRDSANGIQNQAAMQDDDYERPLDEVVRARMYKKKRLEQRQKELEKKAFETEDLRAKCKINFGAKPDTLKEPQAPSKEQEKTAPVDRTLESSGPQTGSFKGFPPAKLSETKPTNSISLFGQPLPSAQELKPEQPSFTLGFNNGEGAVQSSVLSTTSKETAVPQVAKILDDSVRDIDKRAASEGAKPFDPFVPASSMSQKPRGSSDNAQELPPTAPTRPLSNHSFGFKPDSESGHAKLGSLWSQPLQKPSQANNVNMGEKDEEKTAVRSLFGQTVEESKLESKNDAEAKKSEVAKQNEDMFSPASMKNGDNHAKLSLTTPDSKADETMNTSDNAKRRVDTHNPNGKRPFTSFPLSSASASANPPSRSSLRFGLDSGKKAMDGTGTTGEGVPLGTTGTGQNYQEGGKEAVTGTGTETDLQPGMGIVPTAGNLAPTKTTGTDQDHLRGAQKDSRTGIGTGLHLGMAMRRGTGTAVDPPRQTGEAWKETGTEPSLGTCQSHRTRPQKGSEPESTTGIRTGTVMDSKAQAERKPETKEVSDPQADSDVNRGAGLFKPRVHTGIYSNTEAHVTENAPTSTAPQGSSTIADFGKHEESKGSFLGTSEQPKASGPQHKGEEGVQQAPSTGFPQISIPKPSGSVFGSAARSIPEIKQSNKTEAPLAFGVEYNEAKEEENSTVKSKADASKPVFGNGQSQPLSSAAGTPFSAAQSTPFSLGTGNSSNQTNKLSFGSKNPFGLTQSGSDDKSGGDAMATTDLPPVVKDSKPVFSTENKATQAAPFAGFQPTPFGSVVQETPSAPFAFGKPEGDADKQSGGPFGDAKFNRGFQLDSASSFVFGSEKPLPEATAEAEAFGGAPIPSTTGGPSTLKPDLPQSHPFAKPPLTVSPFATAPSGFGAAVQGQGFSIPGSSGALGTSSASGNQSAFPTPGFGTSGTPGFGPSGSNPVFSFGASGTGNSGPAFGGPGGLSASNPFGTQGSTSSVFGSTPFNAPEPKPFGATPSNPFASGNPFGGSGAQAGPVTGGNESTGSGQGSNAFGAPSGQTGSGAGAGADAASGAGAGAGAFAMGTAPRRKLKARRMLR